MLALVEGTVASAKVSRHRKSSIPAAVGSEVSEYRGTAAHAALDDVKQRRLWVLQFPL